MQTNAVHGAVGIAGYANQTRIGTVRKWIHLVINAKLGLVAGGNGMPRFVVKLRYRKLL